MIPTTVNEVRMYICDAYLNNLGESVLTITDAIIDYIIANNLATNEESALHYIDVRSSLRECYTDLAYYYNLVYGTGEIRRESFVNICNDMKNGKAWS